MFDASRHGTHMNWARLMTFNATTNIMVSNLKFCTIWFLHVYSMISCLLNSLFSSFTFVSDGVLTASLSSLARCSKTNIYLYYRSWKLLMVLQMRATLTCKFDKLWFEGGWWDFLNLYCFSLQAIRLEPKWPQGTQSKYRNRDQHLY